jgi:hypothetical protein
MKFTKPLSLIIAMMLLLFCVSCDGRSDHATASTYQEKHIDFFSEASAVQNAVASSDSSIDSPPTSNSETIATTNIDDSNQNPTSPSDDMPTSLEAQIASEAQASLEAQVASAMQAYLEAQIASEMQASLEAQIASEVQASLETQIASESQARSLSDGASSTIVYITDTGKKYHISDCQYLWNSKHETTLEQAKAEGNKPCSICDPPN